MTLEAQARAIQSKVQKNLDYGIARGPTNTARFASQKMQQQCPRSSTGRRHSPSGGDRLPAGD